MAKVKKTRPLLRGVSHLIAFILSLYTGYSMYMSAPPGTEVTVLLYVCSISACFGASALLHIPTWSPLLYRRMRQLDHSMVFVLIACTYNILSILPDGGRAIIWIGWIGAIIGISTKVFFFTQIENGPKLITSLPYMVLGWCCVWELQRVQYYTLLCGWEGVLLCVIGGISVTVGAMCYTKKRPNPIPGVFGHHEILHIGVIIAVYCFYLTTNLILKSYPTIIAQKAQAS